MSNYLNLRKNNMNRFGVLNLVIAIGLVALSVTDAIDCNNKPDFKAAKDCCPFEGFATSEIKESCKSLMSDDDGPPADGGGPGGKGHHGPKHRNSCYHQCIMNATEMVNFETMTVDEAKMKAYLPKALSGTPDFVQPVQDAIVKCAEKGKEMKARHANDDHPHPSPPPGSCKPCASMLMHCVKMETMINCPTSTWKNDEACNNLREFMMVCKPKGPPPPK
uniref:OBP3 n=1 Tax=Episyrphus balteatus TaxID=286459 RepID=A0A6H0D2Y3_EPIBA|nr:OBP3 [Episyrphus balteatus]